MADITVWNGISTFSPGQTPMGHYDLDPAFQADADRVAKFCATRLGYPLMEVELQSGSFYALFEEAIATYQNEVFQYKIRENYLSMEGSSTGSLNNNQIIQPTLQQIVNITSKYGTEAGVGGNVTKHTGSLHLEVGKQEYDLNSWASSSGITGKIDVRKIFYEAPPAIMRFFDPYAGTGTGIQSMMDAFDFGSFSPGINFMLMPASYDTMKIQAIEFNDQIRRSSYSFEMLNNQLTIFPIPKKAGLLRFEYYKVDDKMAASYKTGDGLVTNVGEVPYIDQEYYKINSVGRQWIRSYTLALAQELLGLIRGKYQSVPIPGSETTLNHADLLSLGAAAKDALIENLREMLDQTSRQNQLDRRATESEHLARTLKEIPMVIFVG